MKRERLKILVFIYLCFNVLSSFNAFAQLDITFQRLNINVNPDTFYIEGETVIYFHPLSNTSNIQFDLNDTLQIISLKYQNNEYPFIHANHRITIQNPLFFQSNRTDSVYIKYKGVPVNTFNNNSLNKEIHEGVPIIWTQSQPYGCADWWPTQNSLSDKIDSIDIFIESPSIYRSASNGILISDTIVGLNRLSYWKHRYPIIPYLVAFSVTNYIMYFDTAYYLLDTIPIMNFVFPEYEAEYRANSFATAIMMNYFNNTYGEYPFHAEKYGHAQIPGNGGMENQTITFLSRYSYMLVAHELAHHWFGNYITCSSWSDIWLNEGFATYVSNLLLNYEPSPNGFDYWRSYCVESITSIPDGSVWVNDTTNRARIFSGRLSYEKGGMLLHMIHYQIGDSLYYKVMSEYLNSSNYGLASTIDFKTILENKTQQNFDNFFNFWFWNQGYPLFDIECTTTLNNDVQLKVAQRNSTVNPYSFNGDLEVLIKDNSHDTLIRIPILNNQTFYTIKLGFSPDSVVVNPNHHIITPKFSFRVNKTILTSQLWVYPNPVTSVLNVFCQEQNIKKVKVFDVLGNCVYESINMSASSFLKIDVSDYQKGVYLILTSNVEGGTFTNYFIKN